MRNNGYRLTAAVTVMAMLLTGLPLSATAEEAGKETTVSLNANVDRAPYFSEVLASYPDTPGGDTVTVPAGEVEGEPLTWTADMEKVSWEFQITAPGRYVLSVDYRLISRSGADAVRSLELDGQSPFFEADYLVFPRSWREEGPVRVNSLGDEVRPQTVENTGWQTLTLRDGHGFYSTPLIFYLTEGTHTFSLSYVKEDLELGTWTLSPYQAPAPYQEPSETGASGYALTFQVEDSIQSKNDASIRMEADADPSAEPFAYGNRLLNAVGGWRWREGGQEISFTFTVPEDGCYQISLRYIQKWNDGLPAYRTILLDGEIPCAELEAYRFSYGDNWQDAVLGGENGPYVIYSKHKEAIDVMRVSLSDLV